MKVLIAYIPVIHKGYMNLFEKCLVQTLYVVGKDIVSSITELDYVERKDSLRALPAQTMVTTLNSMSLFDEVHILRPENVSSVLSASYEIHMPREDVSVEVAKKYFSEKDITYHDIFLRWNRANVESQTFPTCLEISLNKFEKRMMGKALKIAEQSSDWWRHVGAVVAKDEEILLTAFNKHVPSEQSPYVFGDPRSVFKKGVNIELSTAEHAEARVVAEAARYGISLEGADLFVTDFPCPPCARLIASSGIKRLYFHRGYAILDGEEVLKDKVEVIVVR